MTALKDRLVQLIETDGPMPLSTYMTLCLHDPQHGYYATRPGLGRDFITAPEISQIFGDLIGLWAADCWSQIGRPAEFNLVELGPGRGTLMADALRATRSVDGFQNGLCLQLIEASPALQRVQANRLSPWAPVFLPSLNDLPAAPTILIANEYLDCLPARQFVQSDGDWRERVVGVDAATKQLVFGLSIDRSPEDSFPISKTDPAIDPPQSVEIQPGLDQLIETLAARAQMGAPLIALLIDYGEVNPAPQDTLRAFQNGIQIEPLEAPGESDLTVDVDFGRLKRLAQRHGLHVSGPIEQGQFLLSLGAETHLNRLAAAANDGGQSLFEGVKRLVDPAEMGSRFKLICISNVDSFSPAGF
ncbi:MAG: SAM-dependent methyltransferase [Pseudomonadota bacterium]